MAFSANNNFKKFQKKVWLSSPTMHGEELQYITKAYQTNWMSTVGENINEVERLAAEQSGCKYAVALSCGTAALHLCVKLAGEREAAKSEKSEQKRQAGKAALIIACKKEKHRSRTLQCFS